MKGTVRDDQLLIELSNPISSSKREKYSRILICTRHAGSLLKEGSRTLVNVAISQTEDEESKEASDNFKYVTQGTVTIH